MIGHGCTFGAATSVGSKEEGEEEPLQVPDNSVFYGEPLQHRVAGEKPAVCTENYENAPDMILILVLFLISAAVPADRLFSKDPSKLPSHKVVHDEETRGRELELLNNRSNFACFNSFAEMYHSFGLVIFLTALCSSVFYKHFIYIFVLQNLLIISKPAFISKII